MDSDRVSAQVGRLEVVETGRRRRWSEAEKLKIVLESLQAPRQVAATARRYGVSRSLLLRWRRSFRAEPTDAPAQPVGFVPATVVPEAAAGAARRASARSRLSLRLAFACGSLARSMRRR
jgi:transposase